MSAWPEAVWIVKKLKAEFDFSAQINQYTSNINLLNGRVNGLIDKNEELSGEIEEDKRYIDSIKTELESRSITFFSNKDNSGNPTNPPQTYGDGTIWLVTTG